MIAEKDLETLITNARLRKRSGTMLLLPRTVLDMATELKAARKALAAVRAVERRNMQNGPDCKRCDEYERKCDCAEPDVEIMRAVYVLSRDLDAALALAKPEGGEG